MTNLESRFSAQVAKHNSISNTTKLPECITSSMLLKNSAIDNNQRFSFMSAAAPSGVDLHIQSSNNYFLAAVTYSAVASVIKEFDKSSHSSN